MKKFSPSDFCFRKMCSELERRKNNGRIPLPAVDEPIEKPSGSLFSFAVFGDPQVSNYMFARESCFYAACCDFCSMQKELDALVMVGDLTENGMKCEYRMVAKILNELSDKIGHFILTTGNHDIRLRPFQKQQKRFRTFVQSVQNGLPPQDGKYWYACDFDACRFLVMGADTGSFEGAYLSKKQLNWLDSELSQTEAQGKIAFVLNHQPLKKTHGLPQVWQSHDNRRGSVGNQSDALRAVFNKHKNVFFLTGHLHQGVCENSFEDYGAYKCLSVPTVGAGNHGSYGEDSQGYVVHVFRDRVEFHARLFGQGRNVPKNIANAHISVALK
ncbi:MAG TPA: hypothetical protein DDY98_08465 [Ruminococcaceae bacterium]|nr:hypothetical protein [Oscillospiraceae bacterium]